MQNLYELKPPSPEIQQEVLAICATDPDFQIIEMQAGPLTILTLPPTFAALVRIIIGQQLSTQVAKAIYSRLAAAVHLEPVALLAASDDILRGAGLSRSKMTCCRNVATAILNGSLDLAQCQQQDEAEVFANLTAISGIGPWTAELFMLFALGRLDLFPVGDLAIRRGYSLLKQQEPMISAKDMIQAVEPLRPYRSVAAHLLWHYYRYQTGFSKPAKQS